MKNNKELEKKFKEAIKQAESEASLHIKNMQKDLKDIIKISEKYGVPLNVPITPLEQLYQPKSFDKKWKKVITDEDDDFCYDFEIGERVGWQHSAVC